MVFFLTGTSKIMPSQVTNKIMAEPKSGCNITKPTIKATIIPEPNTSFKKPILGPRLEKNLAKKIIRATLANSTG